MKKLLFILLCLPLMFSCGEANLKGLDKDIENEEDAVDALIILTKSKIEMLQKQKGILQDLSDLSKEMKKRAEDIEESQEDVSDKIYNENWNEEDLEEANNWDEYEDLVKDLEELKEDIFELIGDIEENMSDIFSSFGKKPGLEYMPNMYRPGSIEKIIPAPSIPINGTISR